MDEILRRLILRVPALENSELGIVLIEDATTMVLSCCHIEELPKKLCPIVANVAADLYYRDYANVHDDKKIKSISQGGTTITYEGTPSSTKETDSNDILSRYASTLNEYRRFSW